MIDNEVERLLSDVLAGIKNVLGDRLVGLYLYGSLATGGFEPGISDVDLLAATNGDVTSGDLERLERMHAGIVGQYPAWDDRIEVVYYSVHALGNFKERRSPIAVISPGESLHVREEGAGADWLMNWHLVTHGGRTLFGPDPRSFILPTTNDEFVDSLHDHALASDEWLESVRNCKAQSYVVLTMCRTIVAAYTGEHSSKREAAAWVEERFPDWSGLVQRSLVWRTDPGAADREDAASLRELKRFVAFAREREEIRLG